MEMGKTAICFESMNFSEQQAIINACLMNTAKMINSLQTVNEKTMERNNQSTYTATKTFRDCVMFLCENHDDIFNTAWLECMETYANDPLMPLALFVSKASGKALRKAFYWNAKSASEKVDTETAVNIADNIPCFQSIFDKDRLETIVDNIRIDIRANSAKVIQYLIIGYNYSEIAEKLDVSANTIAKYVSAISNAIALVNANGKDWNALQKIIDSDISFKDSISRKIVERAIIAHYKTEFQKSENSVIDWQTALERLKAKAYYEYNKEKLASAFYSK